MWETKPWTAPRSSYPQPMAPPLAGPCDPPLVCIQINIEYIKYIAGAMSQLVQRTSWTAVDEDDLQLTLANMTWAIELIGTAVQCQQPPQIGLPGQRACNIAGYLSNQIIRLSMDQAIQSIQQDYNVLSYGVTIMRFIPGAGGIFGIAMNVLNQLYTTIKGGSLTDFQTAIADETLWGKVTCAIYSATSPDGQVTAANYPAIVANVCAISYSLTDVRNAICSYITNLGVGGLQALQPAGALADYDCSNCGGTGPILGPSGPQPTRVSGRAILTIAAHAADALLPILFPTPFPSPPLLTMGSDNEDLIASYENVTTTGFTARIAAAVPVGTATTGGVDYYAQPPGSS
jgi:hypothetical protein